MEPFPVQNPDSEAILLKNESFESRFLDGGRDLSNSAQRISQPAQILTENNGNISGLFKLQKRGQMDDYVPSSAHIHDEGFEHSNIAEEAISTPDQTSRQADGKKQQTTRWAQDEILRSNKTSEKRSSRDLDQDISKSELDYRRSREEDSAANDKSTCHQESDTEKLGSSHKPHKKIESAMVSEKPEASAAQPTVRSKKEEPVISAGTKARWAMLRSLAGSGKNEEEGEEGLQEAQEISGSGQKSVRFDASTREGSTPANKQWPSSERRSTTKEEQTFHDKRAVKAEQGRYVRSSKAAVESALRHSGSSKRQRSRVEPVEPESSMSRAASVKRYMEKLRTDPHIDEIHFVGSAISATQETEDETREVGQHAHQSEKTIEYAVDGHEGEEDGDHNVEQDTDPRDRQFEGVLQRAEGAFGRELHTQVKVVERDVGKHERAFEHETNLLHNDVQGIQIAVEREKERLGQACHTLGGASSEAEHAVGSDLERGARDLRRTLKEEEYLLDRDSHRVERALGKDLKDVGVGMKRIESDAGLEDRHFKYGDHETSEFLRVNRFGGILSQGEGKLKNDGGRIEGALGFGQTDGSIDQAGHQMRLKADEVEGPLMLGGFKGPLDKKRQESNHDTRANKSALNLAGIIGAGGDVNGDPDQSKGNLNSAGHSVGLLETHEAHDLKEPLDGSGRPSAKRSSYDTHKAREGLDSLSRRTESSSGHGVHDMKQVLGNVEAPLLDQDMRHKQIQDPSSEPQIENPQVQKHKSPQRSQRQIQPALQSAPSHQEATSHQQLNAQQMLSKEHTLFQETSSQEQSTRNPQSRQQYRERHVPAPMVSSSHLQVPPSVIAGPEPMQQPIDNNDGLVENFAMTPSRTDQTSGRPHHGDAQQHWQEPLQQPSRILLGQNDERQPGTLESLSPMPHMSPYLDPSEAQNPDLSPHTAIFEQLIFGFMQSCNIRLTASGGSRGFADQMTELLVMMAEDALPAIRQRLNENARR